MGEPSKAPSLPEYLQQVRETVTAHKAAALIDECTEELRALNDELDHDHQRDKAFREFMENSDDPKREKHFDAPCGCVMVLQRLSDDGETTYRAWNWTTAGCLGGYRK
jgi:hypothetical protein